LVIKLRVSGHLRLGDYWLSEASRLDSVADSRQVGSCVASTVNSLRAFLSHYCYVNAWRPSVGLMISGRIPAS